jgi:tetratricopeptide (TPR) repeat protein
MTFARLSWLRIFLLMMLAGQGCGDSKARRAEERGLEAASSKDYNLAIAEFTEAIRLKPDDADFYHDRGWAYLVKGDEDKAVADAKKACELTNWSDPRILDMLAAAYSEVGDFDNAIKYENKCLQCKLPKGASESYRQRLSLYEQKKPFRWID